MKCVQKVTQEKTVVYDINMAYLPSLRGMRFDEITIDAKELEFAFRRNSVQQVETYIHDVLIKTLKV